MADAQSLGFPLPYLGGRDLFMSNSGELALGLEKDLGILRYCLILALALEDPKTFREMQPSLPSPHLLMVGSWGLLERLWGWEACHSVLDSLLQVEQEPLGGVRVVRRSRQETAHPGGPIRDLLKTVNKDQGVTPSPQKQAQEKEPGINISP